MRGFKRKRCSTSAVSERHFEEVCRDWRPSDEIWDRLADHYSETEIVEILWVNATEAYFNSMVVPFGISSDGLLGLAGGPDLGETSSQ